MSRLKAYAEKKRSAQKKAAQAGFWPELCRRVDAGQVIPIVSNAVFNDLIFDIDGDGLIGVSADDEDAPPPEWAIEEQLANAWAEEIGFPLKEQHWLPRVALFDRVVNSSDDRDAKTRYLNWLKDVLLFLAEDDPNISADQIEDLRDDVENYTFADIAVALNYPQTLSGQAHTLNRLAQLKLPIYITTSYHNFLERAIRDNGGHPRTQVCFWSDEPLNYVDESHRTDYDFVPTRENPLVYHIFGLESYPESMVLNEDDYLDFLSALSRDSSQERPILPLYLRKALTQSSLVLLGYRLRNWDFRVLFRGLINATPAGLRMFNLSIQLDPDQKGTIVSGQQIKDYLEKYFGSSNFSVEWGTSHGFVKRLWEAMQTWRQ